MKTIVQKQLLSDMLNKRGNALEIVAQLERSLILDDRILQIFFATRACLLSRGSIDISIVHDWLRSNASSHDEALDLAELLYELRGYKQPDVIAIDEETRRFLHPSEIAAGRLIRNPMIRAEYYKACACKGRTGDSNPLKEFQRKYASLITTDSKIVRKK
jgi:hypothetical protein